MKQIQKLALLLVLALAALAVACGGETEPTAATNTPAPARETSAPTAAGETGETETEVELMPIRLPMGYIPDPQYAPFYVAASRGYYAEAGFEVEFDYSFETDGILLVGTNELPFAIVSGEQVILARAQDVPVVYVMEWFQEFPIAVISKTSAGIESPADLSGRSVGIPFFFGATYIGYVGLLQANGLSEADVNASEINFTQVESLLTDQVEAVVGYANNEPIQLAAQGEDINVLYVADYIDLVANGLITNETVMAENPDMVRRFVHATLRGLADVLADPDAAFAISYDFVDGLDESRRPVLDASLPLWQADVLGQTDAAAWANTQEALLASGLLGAPLADLSAAYSNDFIAEME